MGAAALCGCREPGVISTALPQTRQRRYLGHFEQAIRAEPAYALAYAGIANVHIALGAAPYEMVSPREALPKARSAAQKALDIDETLGEAHAARAYISWVYDYDWGAAEKGFRRALALTPGYATAHQWHASFCEHQGRISEALTAIEKARERDPLSLQVNTAVAYVLHYARDYDRAIQQGLKTLELDPAFPAAHFFLADLCAKRFARGGSHRSKESSNLFGPQRSFSVVHRGLLCRNGKVTGSTWNDRKATRTLEGQACLQIPNKLDLRGSARQGKCVSVSGTSLPRALHLPHSNQGGACLGLSSL